MTGVLSIGFPDEADRGLTEEWGREDASEEDRNVNGELMTDLASPYRFRRTVTLSAGGPGCLAAPAADNLPTFAPVSVRNIEPFRLTVEAGQTTFNLPDDPDAVTCRTEAGVLVPFSMNGRQGTFPAAPLVRIVVEWNAWVPMFLTAFRRSRDRDGATVSWSLQAKE